MINRLASRCFIIASIPLGLVAWLLLPPLFSLIIILLLAYLVERYIEVLEVDAGRVQQSNDDQDNEYPEIGGDVPSALLEALPPAPKRFSRASER